MRVAVADEIELPAVDRIAQTTFVVAVQQGNASAGPGYFAEPFVAMMACLLNRAAEFGLLVIDVSEYIVHLPPSQQGRDLGRSDVAAVQNAVDGKLGQHPQCIQRVDDVPVRVADHADLYGSSRAIFLKDPMPHAIIAVIFLSVVGGLALAGLVAVYRRKHYSPLQFCLWIGALFLTRLLWRADLPRRLPLDEDERAVIVCNHRSSIDPFFVQVCHSRPIHWMVAREFCEHPAFRWFLAACEVIPVNRGGIDTAATRQAIRWVQEGGRIGMFPEGRINMTDDFLLPVRPGAAMVALRARAPILPCYIEGSPYNRTPWSPFFMRARVRIHFGERIDLSDYYDRADEPEIAGQIMLQVCRALAKLAGRDDCEPKLAGRRWKPTEDELQAAMEAQDARVRLQRRS